MERAVTITCIIIVWLFFIAMLVVYIFLSKWVKKSADERNERIKAEHRTRAQKLDSMPINKIHTNKIEYTELEIEKMIKQEDPNFSVEDFLAWVKNLYTKIQYAWSDRNIESIRVFETQRLYEHYNEKLQRLIDNGQINKIENIDINWVKLFDFKQEGQKDYITVLMNVKKIDYIINEKTGGLIRGNKYDPKFGIYRLVFARKTGIKTEKRNDELHAVNCPNCGAPIKVLSSGKCSYCGSIVMSNKFSWVLQSLDLYTGATYKSM